MPVFRNKRALYFWNRSRFLRLGDSAQLQRDLGALLYQLILLAKLLTREQPARDSALETESLAFDRDTARRHVAAAMEIIAAQRRRIAFREKENLPTAGDEELLTIFIGTLARLEHHANSWNRR